MLRAPLAMPRRSRRRRATAAALMRCSVRVLADIGMICLIDNDRILRMGRRLDGRLSFEHGAALARIEPPWPTL